MTILPQASVQRNKRRLDQRESDSAQQLAQSGSTSSSNVSPLESPTSHHSHLGNQHQIDPPLGNRPHSHFGSHSGLIHQQQLQDNAYNSILYNHRQHENTRAQAALTVDTKWRRSPPMRPAADDKYVPPQKRGRRSKTKTKPYHPSTEYAQQDNKNHHSSSHCKQGKKTMSGCSTSSFLPNLTSTLQQSRQVLIPAAGLVTPLSELSPKMPGGAQQKAGTGRKSLSADEANSADEYQNSPSPSGCNSEDEHVPSQQAGHTEEVSW